MHSEFTQIMSLALDDEAGPDEVRRLHAHLRACPACAAQWAQWQILDRRLAAAPTMAPPASLVGAVAQRIAAHDLRRRRTRWVGSGLVLTWLLVFVLGLAGVVGAASWVTGQPQQIATVLSALAHFLGGVTWLFHALAAFLSELGAPRLAAGGGVFVTFTCVLAVMWLWAVGRSHTWVNARATFGG